MENAHQDIVTNVEKMSVQYYIMDKRLVRWKNVPISAQNMASAIRSTGLQYTKEGGVVQIPIQNTSKNKSEISFFALSLNFVLKIAKV